MRTRFLVAAMTMLLVAACTASGDSAPTSTSPSTTTPETTSSTSTPAPSAPATTAPATTSEPSTTTTAAPTSVTTTTSGSAIGFHPVPPIALAPPDPLPGAEGASGSGCAPGSDTLPDGVWFVFMVEALDDAVRGDLACFWFGDIAYEVGEAAGVEVANDYFISNDSDRIRTVPVSGDAIVWTLAGDTTEGHSAVPYTEWPTDAPTYVECPGDFCTVWLFVNDGEVTDIVEQYLP